MIEVQKFEKKMDRKERVCTVRNRGDVAGRVTVIIHRSRCSGLQGPRKVYRRKGERFCVTVGSAGEAK